MLSIITENVLVFWWVKITNKYRPFFYIFFLIVLLYGLFSLHTVLVCIKTFTYNYIVFSLSSIFSYFEPHSLPRYRLLVFPDNFAASFFLFKILI